MLPIRRAIIAAVVAVMLPAPALGDTSASTSVAACDGGTIELRPGSELDYGWTGLAHDSDLGAGASFGFAVLRRCADDSGPCRRDEDCGDSECVTTCDCETDTTCELTGPVGTKRCLWTLTKCNSNADCDPGIACVHFSAPPLPLSSGGTPVCIVSHFDEPLTGSADLATGQIELATSLRRRMELGITIDKPCPRCGAPNQNPELGDVFTCNGGQFDGAACTVHGVSDEFGGVSYDCPPTVSAEFSSAGVLRLDGLTTGITTRIAQLPCKHFGFTGNPTVPGSNPKCLDKRGSGDPVCTSNADCTRCTGDPTITCTSNADCTGTGNGTCAEAPDQPITCGFWCSCGFCEGTASLPCFDSSQCPEGQQCKIGPGTGNQPNAPQQRPNDCSNDSFTCGETEEERCATTTLGTCELQPYRTCLADADCETFNAGTCGVENRPCFESRITRSGSPSPLGSYCTLEAKPCSTNADCTTANDSCAADIMVPDLAGLACIPATSNSAVNSAGGITGPGALHWQTLIHVCRCGTDDPTCDEFCDALDPCEPDEDGMPCDDGIHCNGADTCAGGSCSQHTGNSCTGPGDFDEDCSESCEETTKSCNGQDPDGSRCSDRYSCTVGDECLAGTCIPGELDLECVTTTTQEPVPLCGDWTGDGEIMASDAQGVLQAAVRIHDCALAVCDFDGSGTITATDALAVLRAAVSLPSDPSCPPSG